MAIKVRVKEGHVVFFAPEGKAGMRKYAGDTFFIENESQFSERAMEKVAKPGPKPTVKKAVKGE